MTNSEQLLANNERINAATELLKTKAAGASTDCAADLSLTIDSSTYVLTAQLKDKSGNLIGTPQTVDLPLESVVVSGAYDKSTREVILTLKDNSNIRFSVADLVDGLLSSSDLANYLQKINDNIVDNPFFEIDQQNKTSYSANGSEVPICDRWMLGGYGEFTRNIDSTNTHRLWGTSGYAYLAQNLRYFNTNNRTKPVTLTVKIDGVVYTQTGNSGNCDIIGPNFRASLSNKKIGSSYKQLTISTIGASKILIEFVKIEAGSSSTPVIKNSYDEDLLSCQKYYLPVTLNGVPAIAEDSSTLKFSIPLKRPMPVTPTLTWTTTGTISGNGTSSQLAVGTSTIIKENDAIVVKVQATGLTANTVYFINDSKILLQADITA